MTIHGIQLGTRPHEYLVPSESDPTKIYHVYMDLGKCTCPGFLSHKSCKHIEVWVPQYIQEMEGCHDGVEGMTVPPPSPTPKPTLSKWVKQIHGKDFITYEGLLAMAFEQGLESLGAEFVSVTAELAIAKAWADFKDGRAFVESADATPNNVTPQIKQHFPRMALTRAKARVLRDALNIGMVSVEELEE